MDVHTKFPTMPGTCQKVCVGCSGVGGCKPILAFSFGQAEQYIMKTTLKQFCMIKS